MTLSPGSFSWLVAHDVRLNWRRFAGMLGTAGKLRPWIIVLVATIVSHAMALPVALWLAPVRRAAEVAGSIESQGVLVAISISIISWMIAQSLFGTMRALYDRGDMDLLMGSPLSAHKVLAAKALAVAGSTFGSLAVLVLPLANMAAVVDGVRWLAIYPALVSLALIATALALFVGIGLFFKFGARKARLVMQLTGALVGGGFVLAAQIVMLLPDAMQAAVLAWLSDVSAKGSAAHAVLGLPVAAALGDGSSFGVMMFAAVLSFGAAVWLLCERFARASLAASGAASPASRTPALDRPLRFRGGATVSLRRKEWRLLLRDPSLFAQISLQIVYTIPLVIVLLKSGALPAAVAIAPSLVVIAAQVAASLAWLTVSGEDAPELIASAPVAPNAVDRAKLTAIAGPVLALLVIPLAVLAMISPVAALLSLVLSAGACTSTALLNLWHPMPGNRRGMLRRHSQSKLLALVEHIIAVLWAVAAVLALIGTAWSLAPIALAVGVLLAAGPGATSRLAQRVRHLVPPVAITRRA